MISRRSILRAALATAATFVSPISVAAAKVPHEPAPVLHDFYLMGDDADAYIRRALAQSIAARLDAALLGIDQEAIA